MSLRIGVVANPEQWAHWDAARAHLEPARVLGRLDTVLGAGELLWAVMDGETCIATATARIDVENECEVILVGGSRYREWLADLDRMIGEAARDAGAVAMVAAGRPGWAKALKGWDAVRDGDIMKYRREL